MTKVNLAEKFARFTDHWHPRVVGTLDDYEIKVVKLAGEFVWHKHDDEDELFLVTSGTLSIAFRDRVETIGPGEFIVVPKGTEHKPFADAECEVVLFERRGVVNTGDAEAGALTVRELERI